MPAFGLLLQISGENGIRRRRFFRFFVHVSEYNGVLYAADCYGELSMHMARLLKDLM